MNIDQGIFPNNFGLFYGGDWHQPVANRRLQVFNPANGALLAEIGMGGAEDGARAIAAAKAAAKKWRNTTPLERARLLRVAAAEIRKHGEALVALDALDCGNPVSALRGDLATALARMEFFAGLATEAKGDTIPMGPNRVNMTLREPLGVVCRIVAFNHPFQFCLSKMAAPLIAGNPVILKASERAPLSALRLAEILGPIFPPGVLNIVTGDAELGATLASHRDVAAVTLVGSVPTGRAIMRAASDTLKHVGFELGGKNALVAYPDADPAIVAEAAVAGMNLAWCGQSCGSLSRLIVHESIHDQVLERMAAHLAAFTPGDPTLPTTRMGALISAEHLARVKAMVAGAIAAGARVAFGNHPVDDPALAGGHFMHPVVLADVTPEMEVAHQEIFGPVQCVMPWRDEAAMFDLVNSVDYGLTAAIYTRDLGQAHRAASEIEAGYIWINEHSRHFLGAPFGGYGQSGLGRDECLSELISFTREKNVHIRFDAAAMGERA